MTSMSQLKQKRKGIEKRTAMWHAEFELANNHRDFWLQEMGQEALLAWHGILLQDSRDINAAHRQLSAQYEYSQKIKKSALLIAACGGLFIAFYLAKQKAMLKG